MKKNAKVPDRSLDRTFIEVVECPVAKSQTPERKLNLGRLIRRNLKIAKLVGATGYTAYRLETTTLSSMVERYVKLVDLCATELAHEEATRRIPT